MAVFDLLPHCRVRNLALPPVRYRTNTQRLTATNATNARRRKHAIHETTWKGIGLDYPLYEDAAAADISAFLRGQGIADPGRRFAAYRLMLSTLAPFLTAETRRVSLGVRPGEARQLTVGLVRRMLDSPPSDLREALRLCRACGSFDKRAAIGAAVAQIARAVRAQ